MSFRSIAILWAGTALTVADAFRSQQDTSARSDKNAIERAQVSQQLHSAVVKADRPGYCPTCDEEGLTQLDDDGATMCDVFTSGVAPTDELTKCCPLNLFIQICGKPGKVTCESKWEGLIQVARPMVAQLCPLVNGGFGDQLGIWSDPSFAPCAKEDIMRLCAEYADENDGDGNALLQRVEEKDQEAEENENHDA